MGLNQKDTLPILSHPLSFTAHMVHGTPISRKSKSCDDDEATHGKKLPVRVTSTLLISRPFTHMYDTAYLHHHQSVSFPLPVPSFLVDQPDMANEVNIPYFFF